MAQRGINKVILVGNLGQDPDVRYTPSGTVVGNLSIATSESWRDKQTGEMKDKTEWHRVVLYGKLAEVARDFLQKGSQVYIEGQLQTRKWQDQQGQDRYTTEVVVQGFNGVMQMLGVANQRGPSQTGTPAAQSWGQPPAQRPPAQRLPPTQGQSPGQRARQQAAPPGYTTDPPPMDFDDDIPF